MKKVLLLIFVLSVLGFKSSTWAEVKFDFGGQLRFRPEIRDNRDFNNDTKDYEAKYGQRVRLNVNAAASENLKGFIEIQDSRQWGSVSNVGTAVNENSLTSNNESLDLYRAYIQVNKLAGTPLSLKAGRQTLVYGDQRLLGHLGWKDEARSFDAIKLFCSEKNHSADIFLAKLREDGGNSFDQDQDLVGTYNTIKMIPNHDIDLYYMLWSDGSNGRRVHTYGSRIKGKVGPVDYAGEGVLQSGDWTTNVDQEAHAFAAKIGYTLPVAKTRIGFEYDRGSGDDKTNTGKHKNFVFPFHTNHAHYGYMDYFSWGNMNTFRISVSSAPVSKLKIQFDYHLFYLTEEKGDWLDVVGNGTTLDMSGKSTYTENQAGSEIDLTVKYGYNKSLGVVAGYSLFVSGDAVKERKGKDDLSKWGYLMMTYKF